MELQNEKQYFEKSIKIYDELENSEDNVINIMESSNLQIGTGSRVWESVYKTKPNISELSNRESFWESML